MLNRFVQLTKIWHSQLTTPVHKNKTKDTIFYILRISLPALTVHKSELLC